MSQIIAVVLAAAVLAMLVATVVVTVGLLALRKWAQAQHPTRHTPRGRPWRTPPDQTRGT